MENKKKSAKHDRVIEKETYAHKRTTVSNKLGVKSFPFSPQAAEPWSPMRSDRKIRKSKNKKNKKKLTGRWLRIGQKLTRPKSTLRIHANHQDAQLPDHMRVTGSKAAPFSRSALHDVFQKRRKVILIRGREVDLRSMSFLPICFGRAGHLVFTVRKRWLWQSQLCLGLDGIHVEKSSQSCSKTKQKTKTMWLIKHRVVYTGGPGSWAGALGRGTTLARERCPMLGPAIYCFLHESQRRLS